MSTPVNASQTLQQVTIAQMQPSVEPQETPFMHRALILTERNIPVAPLPPRTKAAKTHDWQTLATTDLIKLQQMNPDPDGNTAAVARAEIGGFCFFEVDAPNFHKTIEEQTGKKFPETFMVSSSPGKGKGHFYFRQTPKSIALGEQAYISGKDENGKEAWSFRKNNAYVVGPWSVKQDGTVYTILRDSPIADCPDWLVEWIAANRADAKKRDSELDDESPINQGSRNKTLTSILGSARQKSGLEYDALLALARQHNRRCQPPLSTTELEQIAHSIAKYPVSRGLQLKMGGKPLVQSGDVEAQPDDLSWIDLSKAAGRPVFPSWIMNSTSLYEGLARPVSDVNSKYPELIWLPAVQLMLNYVDRKVRIKGLRQNVNMFLGIISSPGKFFKSSSCRLAHEYFEQMELAKKSHPGLKTPEGKSEDRIMISQAGSSEGFGLSMKDLKADHAILFNDELSKLVSKAGIENSSLPHDLLSWYESDDYGNPIKSKRQSFMFPAGTYCFGWQFCTTIRGFNSQWAKIAGIVSGMPDRMFFLITAENPKPTTDEVYVNTVEGSTRTKHLIDKAVAKKEFEIATYAGNRKKLDKFDDPRSRNMVYKFALYFAIDLGLDEIDDECIDRALALVEYRQQAIAFLQPIEAENKEGRLLQEMTRELRQHGGKMTRREFAQNLNASYYGDRFWKMVYRGALDSGSIREFQEPGAHGQTKKMVGLVNDEARWGPE